MKTCSSCREAKDESEYYARQARCKDCNRKARLRTCVCQECGAGFEAQRKASYCLACSRSRAAQASKLVRDNKRPEREALKRAVRISKTWLKRESKFVPCRTCGLAARVKYCSWVCSQALVPHNPRRRSIRRNVADQVYARDGFICQLCNGLTLLKHDPTMDASPELDHILPHASGGLTTVDNLRVTHRKCNRDRNQFWT